MWPKIFFRITNKSLDLWYAVAYKFASLREDAKTLRHLFGSLSLEIALFPCSPLWFSCNSKNSMLFQGSINSPFPLILPIFPTKKFHLKFTVVSSNGDLLILFIVSCRHYSLSSVITLYVKVRMISTFLPIGSTLQLPFFIFVIVNNTSWKKDSKIFIITKIHIKKMIWFF